MPTSLPISVDSSTYAKFNTCVHCGLCLPACPTYLETVNEADSPRGRIHLMKALVDGVISPSPLVLEHLDACLVCRACETACPSGVIYHDLIESVRPQAALAVHGKPLKSRLLLFAIAHIFPYPQRVKLAILPLRIIQKMGFRKITSRLAALLPEPMKSLTATLPPGPVWPQNPPAETPAIGQKRGDVLLLRGCVGSVISPEINRAAITVLAHNGFTIHILPDERCCGAMAAHANDPAAAQTHARALVDQLAARTEDFFVSPIAGCGAQLKALHHVLHDDPLYHDKAKAVVKKMRDITEFLGEAGLRPPVGKLALTVAYHDPCHLLHGQRISETPKALLRQIPGLQLVPLLESDLCCGAAGTYNLTQPEMAAALGQRKIANIIATGASVCATANIGCILQMQRQLESSGSNIQVKHVVELLAKSYAQSEPQSL